MMKRILVLLLAMMMLCAPVHAQERVGAELSYQRIVDFCQYMKEMATGDYLDIKQVPQAQQITAEKWAAGIEGDPRLVVKLDIHSLPAMKETELYFRNDPDVVCMEAVSTTMVQIWWSLCYLASMEGGIDTASYEEIMNVNAGVSAQMRYAEAAEPGDGMYLVLYDNASPILLMVNAENDAVSIEGMFLPSAKIAKSKSYGQVSMYLMLNGLAMTCEEIKRPAN